MALAPGTRLGPYEVVGPAGAGGMGEVYRARDTRLDRTVAIKVLSSDIAGNADLKARFEREARAISALQHPNICTLHDVGCHDGTDFLVMEYLEGETLADRLQRGPLPIDQLLKIAIEIAEALDKAHRLGIIHRDLKPGNVMLTKSCAKLLDFGLAKPAGGLAAAVSSPVSVFSAALTRSSPASPLSSAVTIIGTVQYMAPEQIEGREADARSDIFSFGLVLYEMATGKRAFQGKTQASVVASILALEPPPIESLQPSTPPALSRLIRSCLEKDPEERYQTIHDVKLQLRQIAEAGSQAASSAPTAASRIQTRAAWIVAAVAMAIAIAFATGYAYLALRPKPIFRSHILPPPKTTFSTMASFSGPPVVSPDGSKLAFTARTDQGKLMLYVRAVNSLTAQPLAGTESAVYPFSSPDSRNIGFFADNKLKKIDANGGPPQALCDATNARGGTWGASGVILFAGNVNDPLKRVPEAGGTPVPVSKMDAARAEVSHRWPYFLPDGKHFIFLTRGGRPEFMGMYAGSLDSLEHKLVLRTDSAGTYVPPGYLLFVRDQTLMAQPFSARNLETTGDAVPIAEHVAVNGGVYRAVFSASDNGVLVFQSGESGSAWRTLLFDRQGKQLGAVGEAERYGWPKLSPDGNRLAVSIFDTRANGFDVWVFDLVRGTRTRLTFDPANETNPLWMPDGKKIVFTSDRKGQTHIYAKAADNSGADEAVLESNAGDQAMSISLDGRYIAFQRSETSGKTGFDIWALPLFGDRKPFPVVQTPFFDVVPGISPDGKWMSYQNNESGRMEVYITSFPTGGTKWQVSTVGGSTARWRRDGKELFFMGGDFRLMAVDVNTSGGSLQLGVPHPLFQTAAVSGPQGQYDVFADGKKFIVNSFNVQEGSEPLTLITNWTAELKK
jgi:serine/threonine protein kinase